MVLGVSRVVSWWGGQPSSVGSWVVVTSGAGGRCFRWTDAVGYVGGLRRLSALLGGRPQWGGGGFRRCWVLASGSLWGIVGGPIARVVAGDIVVAGRRGSR